MSLSDEFCCERGGERVRQVNSERYQETYYEDTLSNGLKVILWEKKHYEKSLFMLVTPFGAVDIIQENQAGECIHHPIGVAHFLEHKMFAMKDQDVMNLFSDMGANVNAFTSYQETAYYASTTSDPTAPLNLLLDFVQELDVDETSVEKEKGIIVSELHMYKEMSDQRLLMEVYSSLYQNHPLRYDIGGDDESVMGTSVADLYRSYEMNYHPANMVLICVSGHDPQELLNIIKENQEGKKFSSAQRITTLPIIEPEQVAREHFTFHMDVSVPKIAVAYKLRGIKDPYERLRKEWAIRFLLDANFTTLYPDYQLWLDQEIINDYCGSDIDIGEDYATVMFYAESERVDDFVALCENCMNRIMNAELSDEVLEQLKRRYYAQSIRSMNSFDEIAISYVRSMFMHTDYFKTLDLLHELQQKDIMEAARYIAKDHRAIVELLPNK